MLSEWSYEVPALRSKRLKMNPPMSPHSVLPKHAELSPQQFAFLEERFRNPEDLVVGAPHVLATLAQSCADLDADLLDLGRELNERAASWVSRSFTARVFLHHLNFKLENLSLRTVPCWSLLLCIQTLISQFDSQVDSVYSFGTAGGIRSKIWGQELPQLAKQLRQMGSIRNYVETALRLEALVGDLEDAVFRIMNRHSGTIFSAKESGPKHEKLLQAIKTLNDIEEVLLGAMKLQPQPCNLLKAVDSRVDKIMAVLRPQGFADHRAVLASLGWPPKLFTSKTESIQVSDLPNPLVLMQGDKKKSYSQSFIGLCALQHLQKRREDRQGNLLGRKEYDMELWAIDELVSPIASRMEYHFSKWADQPELIFALAYKITRDFIVGVDDVLQPLIDRARLISCSAKEAWVSAIIRMLSGFLAKNFFGGLAERYKEKHMRSELMTSWLRLVDLIVAFDKRMQLLVNLETGLFQAEFERFQGRPRGISPLTIFCDRPDWLKIWAKIELKDACKKLKAELKDERAWMIDNKPGSALDVQTKTDQYLLSSREDHKAPSVAESALKISWELIERCRTVPASLLRVQFIRWAAVRFLWYFFEVLLLRFQRTEFSHDNSNNDALIGLCGLINAARYVESKLQEWSDDVDILEIGMSENDSIHCDKDEGIDRGCFFGEEIENLSELETNWLMEIISVILREFENLSWEYIQNKEHFELEQADLRPDRSSSATLDLAVSTDFVEALDVLSTQLRVLKMNLNPKDLLDLWRSVAEGLDHFMSCSTLTSEIRFSDYGVSQFEIDMQALICIFQPFCTRPQAFFPCIKETLKLLRMNVEEVRHLEVGLSSGENRMKCFHLPSDQVQKLLRNRKFGT